MVIRPADHKSGRATGRPSGSRAASPLVGRDDELRRLASAVSLAAEGQGRIVFLSGQMGIGKTRLAQEALALAKEQGFIAMLLGCPQG